MAWPWADVSKGSPVAMRDRVGSLVQGTRGVSEDFNSAQGTDASCILLCSHPHFLPPLAPPQICWWTLSMASGLGLGRICVPAWASCSGAVGWACLLPLSSGACSCQSGLHRTGVLQGLNPLWARLVMS